MDYKEPEQAHRAVVVAGINLLLMATIVKNGSLWKGVSITKLSTGLWELNNICPAVKKFSNCILNNPLICDVSF